MIKRVQVDIMQIYLFPLKKVQNVDQAPDENLEQQWILCVHNFHLLSILIQIHRLVSDNFIPEMDDQQNQYSYL